ncbi:hypothetical protein [Streptomyces sp. NPDC003717]|uniref:hypothetical protein n=1 Tax=Streptomyces sp. NPDC003717 TaxID=3154276 RepID=UPI0033BEE63C
MTMLVRTFAVAELAALGVPPDDPRHIEYRAEQRRCVFRAPDDDRAQAVEYEAELDAGDHEVGSDDD